MSRIGKKTIEVPQSVKVDINGQDMKVSGPKGELSLNVHRDIKVELKDGKLFVTTQKKEASNKTRGFWGLYRALIANMVEGTEKGFEKKLEIEGVGYKANVEGENLVLNVG